ncbi:hypothetical protein JFL43_16145 [Viridibacillus sp. YIM B01967]|uniref:ABC3 transporter permease C-terminal domain-containing protein n=1 Tax=Viridibacillus soli TaxID=2798301 RepID=A0ABS1HBA1_9BACL|nr:FtsX-like permease family protein [Viridibacillus soli]MBK3496362.1 hypothetical protein [Viridibacillus soli]
MKIYQQFLKSYYRLHKMQFLGPLFTLTIICAILFGSISANELIAKQTESHFYDQYGEVTQIVRLQHDQFRSEDDFVKDWTGKNKTTYLQSNGVHEKNNKVNFVNFYGVDQAFYKVFPFDQVYELKGNDAVVSASFAKAHKLKKGDMITIKTYSTPFDYQVAAIADGDFFAKEDGQGANILVSKEQFRKNFQLPEKDVTTLAGTDLKVQKHKNVYQTENVRENVSAIGQMQMIQFVVMIIDAVILLVSTYILFGFYRMAFVGKLHYLSILNIIGIQKRRLTALMWLENIVLMTIIYSILAIVSVCLLPLGWIYYVAVYGILLATIVIANGFITSLFRKTDVLAYILGREQVKIKQGWVPFFVLLLVLVAACVVKPTIYTFVLVGISLLFGVFWMLGNAKQSSVQLIKHLNRERIVNEMKAILMLAIISLLLIYAAITGVQHFITGVYSNWKFDQQITVNEEKTVEIQTYLAVNNVEQAEFLWKNYSLEPLDVKHKGEKLSIDDLIGINDQDDLKGFNIKGNIDMKLLQAGNNVYLNEKYKKYHLLDEVQMDGKRFEIVGYFDSSMNATDHVAIVSEESFRKLDDTKISQFYIKNDELILNKLYGEFGDDILGTMDARQQSLDNTSFAQNLQSVLMIFILFIALISILSLLNSFFILRDKQQKLFAILGAAGLSKKKLMSLNFWQIFALGGQGLLIAEVILILVLRFFEWFIQTVIGQNIPLVVTYEMQLQAIGVYLFVLIVVWLASRRNLKKMNILQTIRER